jgi:hypothetical protein
VVATSFRESSAVTVNTNELPAVAVHGADTMK